MSLLPTFLLAIDPGKDKCGVAVIQTRDFDALRPLESVAEHRIVPRDELVNVLRETSARFPDVQIVLGDATTSRVVQEELAAQFSHIPIHIVDESGSTLEARDLYWQAYPPRGWRRLVPLSSQVPPEPLDDFAAVVLVQRFLLSRN